MKIIFLIKCTDLSQYKFSDSCLASFIIISIDILAGFSGHWTVSRQSFYL